MDWPIIIAAVSVIIVVCIAFKKYTESTETKKDDKAGEVVGYIAGFLKFLLNILRGKIK